MVATHVPPLRSNSGTIDDQGAMCLRKAGRKDLSAFRKVVFEELDSES